MWRWFCATLILFLSLHLSLQADEPPSEDLFQKGLAAYQNKQFEEARDNFQNLVAGGYSSAALYHNLALTYFQLDQKAYAMALWRKALAVDSGFRPALAGRTLLESKFSMRPWEKDSFDLWSRRTLETVSFWELMWVIAILLGGCGFIWIRYLAARKIAIEDEQPKPPFPLSAAALGTMLVMTFLLMGMKMGLMKKTRATVVLTKVNVRSLPAEDGVGLFELNGGSEVLVRMKTGEWLQVQNSDGSSGWVKDSEVMVTEGGSRL